MMENLGRKPLRVAPRQPTPQQVRFIAEYLKCLDATQAARSADYSSKHAASIGCNLLKLPHIAAAVKKAMDARAKRTEITQDRVLKELARVAFSDVRATFDEAGQLRSPTELDDDTAAAVASGPSRRSTTRCSIPGPLRFPLTWRAARERVPLTD